MHQVSVEKKKENHSLFKKWNYKRIAQMELHRKICDEFLKGIDKMLKQSLDNFEVFRTFFSERCRQEEIISSSKLGLPDLISNENKHNRNIYIASSVVLEHLAKREKEERRLAQEFIEYIETKILKEIF